MHQTSTIYAQRVYSAVFSVVEVIRLFRCFWQKLPMIGKLFQIAFTLLTNYKYISFSVRGFLVSTMNLTENFGIFLSFVFGAFFDFYMTPKFVIALTILFGITFSFFPESPQTLVKQNRISVSAYQNIFRRI